VEQGRTNNSACQVWILSAWLGLTFGLLESVFGLAWRHLGPNVADPDLWLNWNVAWLSPLGLTVCLLGLSLPIGLARELAPRLVNRLLPRVLIGLGTWSTLGAIPGMQSWAMGLLALGTAVRLGGLARFDSSAFRIFAARSTPWLMAWWLVLFLSTGLLPFTREARWQATTTGASRDRPNVLLVVLDTVRADNLSLYGYERETTPLLKARAKGGVRFTQARATAPFTLGTHASLFTGQWMSRTSAGVNGALDRQHTTLAEHLRDQGYATGGFAGNIFYCSARYGLDRGFLKYLDVPGNITRHVTPRETLRACTIGSSLIAYFERKLRILSPLQRQRLDARTLNAEALKWIDETREMGRPFFAFINYFDAHSPYSLPADVAPRFSRITGNALASRLEHREDEEEVGQLVRDAYDDGISWIDRQLDDLLNSLEVRGLLDNTLVVITADHGEMLGEHQLIGHGNALHRQVVHVPLVVLPAQGMSASRGRVVERAVSLRDLPATVLDLIGDPQKDRFPGASLARHWEQGEPDQSPVLSELEHMPWMPRTKQMPPAFGPMWLITDDSWSYIRQDHESLGRLEWLFDLKQDPEEARNLVSDPRYRAVLSRLRERLAAARG
jgi:arylsulfatase A-like enzyme